MTTETENILNPVNCEKATFTKPPVTKKAITNKFARVTELFALLNDCLCKLSLI